MKNTVILIATLALSLIFSCANPDLLENEALEATLSQGGATSGPPTSEYNLLYEDHFNGSSINYSDWFERTGIRLGGVNLPQNVRVSNSILKIDYKYEDFDNNGSNEYTCGGIISKHNFGYGYYEVKARLYQDTLGLHQSFWNMGSNYNMFDAYTDLVEQDKMPYYNQVLEIDGFEVDSKKPNEINVNNHIYSPVRQFSAKSSIYRNTADWFTMGFEWLDGKINFYYNGDLVKTRNLTGIFDIYAPQNFWLTALATPDPIPFGGAAPPSGPAMMEVDYLRYYAKKSNGLNLLGNASFEYNGSPVSPNLQHPVAWIETTSSGYNSSASFVEASSFSRTGDHRLKHFSNSSYLATTKQILEYIPNGTYRLTAWVKGSGGQNKAQMRVIDYGGPELNYNIPQTNNWTKIIIDNINLTTNEVVIAFTSNASSGQWILVDDVVFENKSTDIVLDNLDSEFTTIGSWLAGTGQPGYFGSDYLYRFTDATAFAKWTPHISEQGDYDIYMRWTSASNRPDNAPVEIMHSSGTSNVTVNQQQNNATWVYLGNYSMSTGGGQHVKLFASDNGYTVADAVKFVKN